MLAAPSAAEALKVLHDLPWAQFLPEAEDRPENFNRLLDAGLWETKREIQGMLENASDFDFLWLLFDLHNAKILLKAKIKGQSAESVKDLLSPLGSITGGQMSDLIFNENVTGDFDWLAPLAGQIEREFEQSADPEQIENVLNREFFQRVWHKACKTGSPLMRNFFKSFAAAENLKSWLRRKGQTNFLPGTPGLERALAGAESLGDFLLRIDRSQSATALANSPAGRRVLDVCRALAKENSLEDFSQLELALDDFLFESLKPSKFEIENVDPIFAFFWTKLRNANIIRTIMIGKLNGLESESLRRRVSTPSLSIS